MAYGILNVKLAVKVVIIGE